MSRFSSAGAAGCITGGIVVLFRKVFRPALVWTHGLRDSSVGAVIVSWSNMVGECVHLLAGSAAVAITGMLAACGSRAGQEFGPCLSAALGQIA